MDTNYNKLLPPAELKEKFLKSIIKIGYSKTENCTCIRFKTFKKVNATDPPTKTSLNSRPGRIEYKYSAFFSHLLLHAYH